MNKYRITQVSFVEDVWYELESREVKFWLRGWDLVEIYDSLEEARVAADQMMLDDARNDDASRSAKVLWES